MKTTNAYHIDVTPEEDQLFRDQEVIETKKDANKLPSKAMFVKVLCVVFGIHVVAAAVVGLSSVSANAANIAEDKKLIGEQALSEPAQPLASSAIAQATPSPTPETKPKLKQEDWPKSSQPLVTTKPPIKADNQQVQKQTNGKYTTHYTVKQGDTVSSIARKYKLNTNRLLKINDIKDPTKLRIGQTLKFM
jgi:LysM repeat protein